MIETSTPKPLYDYHGVRIYCGDATKIVRDLSPGVHLTITSPPYNVGMAYEGYDDNLSSDEWNEMLYDVFSDVHQITVYGGRIAVVVPMGVGRNPWEPIADCVTRILSYSGWILRGQIVWYKATTGNRTTWGSFRLPTDPSLRDTCEIVIVAHKGSPKLPIPDQHIQKDEKGRHTRWLSDSNYFAELTQNLWHVPPARAKRVGHPSPFPAELVRRLVHLYGFPGARLLDPFAGSGTVGVVAEALGCEADLIEISPTYCRLAALRIGITEPDLSRALKLAGVNNA